MNVQLVSSANLPTKYGNFKIFAFNHSKGCMGEHIAIVKGNVKGRLQVPVRVHSECLTGDVFGSIRCDCGEQLQEFFRYLNKQEYGILLYMKQEGRGIGLSNKILAYHLQEKGLDTVQANLEIGFPEDMRDYSAAASMLKLLAVKSIILLTNNPKKVKDLTRHGIVVEKVVPLRIKPNPYNAKYLKTKKEKMGHLL